VARSALPLPVLLPDDIVRPVPFISLGEVLAAPNKLQQLIVAELEWMMQEETLNKLTVRP